MIHFLNKGKNWIVQHQARWLLPFGIVIGLCLNGAWQRVCCRKYTDPTSYALGALAAHPILHQWSCAHILNMPLSIDAALEGVSDALQGRLHYTPEGIQQILDTFFEQIAQQSRERLKIREQKNQAEDAHYLARMTSEQSLQIDPTSGIQYQMLHQTNGKQPGPHSRVVIHCLGKFSSGFIFENTYVTQQPLTLQLDQLNPSLQAAIRLLREGEKGFFVIRSGTSPVLPKQIQLFEIELLKIDPPL